jgi:peptide/nickel transport system permease protein
VPLLDRFIRVIGLVAISVPTFWLGIVLVEIFAVQLGLLPTSGSDSATSVILPAITMALYVSGGTLRLLRVSVKDALASQYVVAARARGLRERAVIFGHVLRNAAAPAIAFAGLNLPMLVSSAVVVETIFTWPGLGRLAYEAAVNRDFPVIQAVAIVGSVTVVLASLLVDVIQAIIDPRVRRQWEAS